MWWPPLWLLSTAMGNGKYTLKAVRRGKNGWGKAGVNDTTAPF